MNETTNQNTIPFQTPYEYPAQNPVQQAEPQHFQQPVAYQEPEPKMNQYTQPVQQQKPYTLKRLQSKDVFPMLRILSKIGMSELKECFSSHAVTEAISRATESGKDIDLSAVGVNVAVDIASVIVTNIPKCEQDIYAFLSQLSGMHVQDIADLDAVVFFEMIVDVIKKPEFRDFMKVVSGLLK